MGTRIENYSDKRLNGGAWEGRWKQLLWSIYLMGWDREDFPISEDQCPTSRCPEPRTFSTECECFIFIQSGPSLGGCLSWVSVLTSITHSGYGLGALTLGSFLSVSFSVLDPSSVCVNSSHKPLWCMARTLTTLELHYCDRCHSIGSFWKNTIADYMSVTSDHRLGGL